MFNSFSCNSQGVEQTFNEYLKKVSTDKAVIQIKKDFKDTLESWIDKKLDYVLFLTKTDWKLDDAVYLNKAGNRALLLLLVRVKDADWLNDYVKVIGAEKLNDSWHFYYASYLVMEFSRKENNDNPNSFELLAQRARKNLNEDGFIKCGLSCKVDYHYLDSDIWFAEWVRQMHKRFLANQLPTHPLEKDHNIMH
jgi:hypothetical protein